MKTSDFNYDLPEELIAQEPLEERSASRLLVLDKNTGAIEHRVFKDITDYLRPEDCIVINDTRVMPARLLGEKKGSGGSVEILLLRRLELDKWEVLVRPGKKMKMGAVASFGGGKLEAEVLQEIEGGNRIVRFSYNGVFEQVLDELGEMPLPPYITRRLEDRERYQTVYAVNEGSAAAPTAGLHFTPRLIEKIEAMGVNIARLTLHVGLGTFRPVKAEDITDHAMHSEYYIIDQENAEKINAARRAGGRIISVGTTSARTLETVADENGDVRPASGYTDIFIYPGYSFKAVDCLITNFHLPESTLIMLVSALAGRGNVMNAYREAVENRYRFFSFGDAMFITDKQGRE